ncbi:VTT domain-containing protein [Candidatus Puniceispirillum sp.]|nr:VTT domain-containing protein [Candidatus Puniceispirillum sp.]
MQPPNVRRLILPGVLLAGFLTFFASGTHEFFSWQILGQHYKTIKGFSQDKLWLSYLGFFCAYLAVVAFSLPIAGLLTLAGGAILGWPAATLVVIAATAGAGVVFFATKNLFSDVLQRRAGPFLNKMEDGFYQNAFFYLLALRLVPTVPFWVLNIVPALTRMSIAKFLAATFIGIIPGSCVYVWVGRSFDQVLLADQTPDIQILTSPNLLLPFVALGAVALIPTLIKLRQARAKKPIK